MRVGIDATGWTNRRGHGRFARGAVGRLVELDTDVQYVLYADQSTAPEIDLPAAAQLRAVHLAQRPGKAAAAGSSRTPRDLLRMTRAVARDSLAAFLFPSVYTWFPTAGIRTAVGVHDMTARRMPELTMPDRRSRALWRLKEGWAIRSATQVFSVSESARASVAREFGIDPVRIPVVFEAPEDVFAPRVDPPGFGLERGRYLLFVGGVSPHKNLATLVRAYAVLAQGDRDTPPPLVIAGELERDPYMSATAQLSELIDELHLRERVVLTGFVSDEQLARLYSSATATVLPSLSEGFDLPAVEAAACGSPVVLSELGPHRETLGDAGMFFPATDVSALASALGRVLDDAPLRARLSERALAAAAKLSWDAAAAALAAIVRSTAMSPASKAAV